MERDNFFFIDDKIRVQFLHKQTKKQIQLLIDSPEHLQIN